MQKEMQNKITRLLYELNALNKGPINLAKMAQELGVSLRTLQRDMNTIQEAEFPLWTPSAGNYAFVEGFSLEKMQLSGDEASMLVLMSDFADSLGSNFGKSFKQLKKRILTPTAENPFFIKLSTATEFPDTVVTKALASCIRGKEKISLCYKGGKLPSYLLRPLKLLWVDGFWYLLSLTDDDKLLKFRLEKITSVTPTGNNFKHDNNIEKILHESTNIWFDTKRPLHALLEISAENAKYFKSKQYFPAQKLEKELPDGRIVISCKASQEEEIIHTILAWIPRIKVLEPKSLQEFLSNLLKQYVKENLSK